MFHKNHRNRTRKAKPTRPGSVLVLVVISMTVLATLGLGLTAIGFNVRRNAIQIKTETAAMLAAEAGYEKAVFWMGQQSDMLSALASNIQGTTGSLSFEESSCAYSISLHTFIGSRPVYRIVSKGYAGAFSRTVDCLVVQATSGWDMGKCRIPTSATTTNPVNFASGETIDMPIQINKLDDSPDERDIYISGTPTFLQAVAMAESRRTSAGTDKYGTVMPLFRGGIYFSQPQSRILDEEAIALKIARFRDSTKSTYRFTPTASASVTNPLPAVQLEFYLDNKDVGKIRITNNCTVRGFQQSSDSRTYDYRIRPGYNGERYERYSIYGYHVVATNANGNGDRMTCDITDTYVSQSIGGVQSTAGGQIYVDGNVVIGGDFSDHNGDQLIKGTVTVVATGNIWVADSIRLDGSHDLTGIPSSDNPNALGLIAQGVIKVVDPGMSDYSYVDGEPDVPQGYKYAPIGIGDHDTSPSSTDDEEDESSDSSDDSSASDDSDDSSSSDDSSDSWWDEWWSRWGGGWGGSNSSHGNNGNGNGNGNNSSNSGNSSSNNSSSTVHERHLPDPVVVEAAMTIGGGGWGAENVARGSYGGRKETSGSTDDLIVRGAIIEGIRGVVGIIGSDGFSKQYYLDERLIEGILPGDMWLRGKFLPAPAGWRDYRAVAIQVP